MKYEMKSSWREKHSLLDSTNKLARIQKNFHPSSLLHCRRVFLGDSFEASELGFHVILCPAGSEGIEAPANHWIGNFKLKSVEQTRASICWLTLPAIASFEKSLKFPDH